LFKKFILCFFLILALIAVGLTPVFSEDRYIQITGEKVNIRFKNDLNSTVVAKAGKGDVFELKSEKGNWYEINMFTGEYRYIHNSLATVVAYSSSLPSLSTARAMWSAFGEAEDKSMLDAEKKYPISQNMNKNIEYSRILEDRYKLQIFHKYNIPPVAYMKILTEGAKRGWR
jgi:uncharacterized protein YgiM (DUF1202 family)